jgi:hypothetical protein
MAQLSAIEIKAFVPARDFALSKQFYEDLGFTIAWSEPDLSYLRCGDCSFLLQNFYNPEHAGNFMMHMLVPDACLVAICGKFSAGLEVRRARRAASRSFLGPARLDHCRSDRRIVADRAEYSMKRAL